MKNIRQLLVITLLLVVLLSAISIVNGMARADTMDFKNSATYETETLANPVLMETEDFVRISGDMELIHDWGAGGDNTIIAVPNGANTSATPDAVSYVFTVSSSGQYHFTGRAKAPTGADDSFCVNLIDIATGERIWDTTEPSQCGEDIYWDFYANSNWQEVVLSDGWNGSQTQVVVNLTAGRTYQITVRLREDGTLLDWLKLHQGTPSVSSVGDSLQKGDLEAERAMDEPE